MQFRALIVDPNPTIRAYLWQATLANVYFERVKACSKIATALNLLEQHEAYDVILLASTIPKAEMDAFVLTSKQADGGKEAAYIVILKAQHQNTENVAEGLLHGLDGFLLEPFSADSLKRVALVAARVKKEFERQRSEAAIRIIVADILKTLRGYLNATILGEEVNRTRRDLQKSVAALQKIPEEHRDLYFEIATEMFGASAPRPSIGYHGASKRLKKKLQKKRSKRAEA